MDIQYLALSFSHKNTPINVREKLAIAPQKIECFLQELKQKITAIDEVLLLSTCNRVEFYIITYTPQECIAGVLDLFGNIQGISFNELEKYCKIALNQEAVHHIFGVASGLDSVVIGETQITGQIKSAYKMCFDLKVCGQNITRLIHFAFRCAAQVRKQTQISQASLSVASIAVKKALCLDSDKKEALVIGIGEIGKLATKHLLDSGFSLTLINRDKQKALDFIKELQADKKDITHIKILDFCMLGACINDFSFVFSATSAQFPIITLDMLQPLESKRFFFDLAVPRDIDENIQLENLEIFCVDDLKHIADENMLHKKVQAHQAYAIIGEATRDYFMWLQTLDVEPMIKQMRQKAKEASLQELHRAIKKGYLPKEWEEEVKIILHNAFNVFLHNPTLNLKDMANKAEGDNVLEALRRVFDNKRDSKFLNRYKCEYDTTR